MTSFDWQHGQGTSNVSLDCLLMAAFYAKRGDKRSVVQVQEAFGTSAQGEDAALKTAALHKDLVCGAGVVVAESRSLTPHPLRARLTTKSKSESQK